jgi:hypothetical protein
MRCSLVFKDKVFIEGHRGSSFKALEMRGRCHFPSARPTCRSANKLPVNPVSVNDERYTIPIHLVMLRLTHQKKFKRGRTGAERVVGTLELLAWCKVFAFRCNTLEVIRVVLEACVVGSDRS